MGQTILELQDRQCPLDLTGSWTKGLKDRPDAPKGTTGQCWYPRARDCTFPLSMHQQAPPSHHL